MSAKLNLFAILLFAVVMTGCGGGETTTTTGLTGGTPAPAPAPAPAPGGSDNFSGTGTASLNWAPPTTYTDNSTLGGSLSGHNIYVDDGTGYVKVGTQMASDGLSFYTVENLSIGTYTFVVTAFDSQGGESSFSNSVIVEITS